MAALLEPIDRRAVADHRWSVASLVATNLLPLAGVLLLGWRTFDVVFLYWMENVVIGAINVLKIVTCAPDARYLDLNDPNRTSTLLMSEDEAERVDEEFREKFGVGGATVWHASKLFFAPFFAVHYGGFCAVHGLFVCVLLGGDGPLGPGAMNPVRPALDALASPGIQLAVLGLAVSHLISYFSNFLGRGEFRRTTPVALMAQPYGRVVVLHIAIVLSGFLTFALGSPIWLLVLLIVGKTWLDLKLHLREHEDTSAEG